MDIALIEMAEEIILTIVVHTTRITARIMDSITTELTGQIVI